MPTPLDRIRQAFVVVFVAFGVAVNYMAPSSMARIARASEPLLAASGWAFSIWGVIFAGQIAYAIYQALPSQGERPLHRDIGWLVALNGSLTGLWTVLFARRDFTLAWMCVLGVLLVQTAIEAQLGRAQRKGADFWIVRAPFGLSFGWAAVATMLGTAQFLHAVQGYDGAPMSPQAWSILLVAVAAAFGVAMATWRRNESFALAVAWGLAGVAAYRAESRPLATASMVCVAVLVTVVVAHVFAHASQIFRFYEPRERGALR